MSTETSPTTNKIITLQLPSPHAAQRRILREARRFNVVCCGRRFGKTTLGLDPLIRPALQGKPTAWFAPSYRILIPAWREVRRILTPLTTRRSDQEHRIELITGGVVEMWSLEDPDAPRGRAYAVAIIDEAARVAKLERAWTEVIRATLTDYEGAAWFLSTPRGLNYYHTLFQRGQDPTNTEWASWQMPTSENPYIRRTEIEAAREGLPELVFAQEYLAQFVSGDGTVFRRVRDAAVATPQEGPVEGHEYLVSIDWAKHQDWTVLAVWDATLGELVALDRFQQIDYSLQLGRLQALCERWRPVALAPERNSIGDVLLETIASSPWCPPVVLPFTTTNASKAQAVELFALALEQGAVRIIDDPVLTGELMAFEGRRLPSGLISYQAPEGGHDDCVMAAIIGYYSLMGGLSGPQTIVVDEPVQISPY